MHDENHRLKVERNRTPECEGNKILYRYQETYSPPMWEQKNNHGRSNETQMLMDLKDEFNNNGEKLVWELNFFMESYGEHGPQERALVTSTLKAEDNKYMTT